MNKPLAVYSYQLDPENRIIHVSNNWYAFARENDGTDFIKEKILNLPLWNFIRDNETIHLFDALFFRVRTTASYLRLPLNCDSPDCRRTLELHMSPLPGGSIMCSNHVLEISPREVPAPLLDSTRERSDDLVRMCSWCKKIVVAEAWLDLERAIVDLGLFKTQPLPRISHGICPSCLEICSKLI